MIKDNKKNKPSSYFTISHFCHYSYEAGVTQRLNLCTNHQARMISGDIEFNYVDRYNSNKQYLLSEHQSIILIILSSMHILSHVKRDKIFPKKSQVISILKLQNAVTSSSIHLTNFRVSGYPQRLGVRVTTEAELRVKYWFFQSPWTHLQERNQMQAL